MGYVGVGRVIETVQPAAEFMIETSHGPEKALDVLEHGGAWRTLADDAERSEYFVRVRWLDTRPLQEAFNEVGLFGNQNSVCQPRSLGWRHTVERLKEAFPNWDA